MKTQLLITAAACLVPAFSHMSSAQEKAVDVYVSSITQSFRILPGWMTYSIIPRIP